MDNIIELAPYLNSSKEDAEQEKAEPLEGVVVVEFNNESCEFRLGFSDKDENCKELTPELIDVAVRDFDVSAFDNHDLYYSSRWHISKLRKPYEQSATNQQQHP